MDIKTVNKVLREINQVSDVFNYATELKDILKDKAALIEQAERELKHIKLDASQLLKHNEEMEERLADSTKTIEQSTVEMKQALVQAEREARSIKKRAEDDAAEIIAKAQTKADAMKAELGTITKEIGQAKSDKRVADKQLADARAALETAKSKFKDLMGV